jgi:hypothetical protein
VFRLALPWPQAVKHDDDVEGDPPSGAGWKCGEVTDATAAIAGRRIVLGAAGYWASINSIGPFGDYAAAPTGGLVIAARRALPCERQNGRAVSTGEAVFKGGVRLDDRGNLPNPRHNRKNDRF